MADGFSLDVSEVDRLAADLGRIPARTVPLVESVMKRGAQNVKTDMQVAFQASPHFKGVAAGVSYDRVGVTSIGYEVGPEIGRAGGSLGSIAVEGGANGGGGTVNIDGVAAAEAPNLERELGKIADGLL